VNSPNSSNETGSETPLKRIPRSIIYGSILICLGVAIILYNKKYFHGGDILWFIPFAIVIWGLYRIFKKGFFNVFGQVLMLGGIQLHLAFLGVKTIAEYWYPITIIWIGALFLIKGILLKIKQRREQKALDDLANQEQSKQSEAISKPSVPVSVSVSVKPDI